MVALIDVDEDGRGRDADREREMPRVVEVRCALKVAPDVAPGEHRAREIERQEDQNAGQVRERPTDQEVAATAGVARVPHHEQCGDGTETGGEHRMGQSHGRQCLHVLIGAQVGSNDDCGISAEDGRRPALDRGGQRSRTIKGEHSLRHAPKARERVRSPRVSRPRRAAACAGRCPRSARPGRSRTGAVPRSPGPRTADPRP